MIFQFTNNLFSKTAFPCLFLEFIEHLSHKLYKSRTMEYIPNMGKLVLFFQNRELGQIC